ncbi:LOW QUALITY PROTEIN: 2-amino-4-hydroxy-6-hydroxymethyldihydropteridine pyrophosphokinase [Limimaricola cinnabarinus LL-001]|uniref:2-amino-4-hydroxy-6-hydroxymethyldihydropteridine pyrophosphokinase n=1 Tax=Limimaricola cinnabarinus LL-001 TaxID=1337093 RepID=U2YZG6_9RHOB|nr:LOW QUALITY PROTEIN: 2-amino-4-hydroxy-6-hydroxymethyldihydropteridine pyrophosphokinase [Limimaricola cinnabarinus LL-001]
MAQVAALGSAVRESRLWRSPAFPAGIGPDFVNAVMVLETERDADDLLAELHRVEAAFGRERQTRWGPRSLDLDLLALDDLVLPDLAAWSLWRDLTPEAQARETPDRLILPHPRLQDRGFVLAPLAEVAPDWRHPVTGFDVTQMRDALPTAALDGVEPLDRASMMGPLRLVFRARALYACAFEAVPRDSACGGPLPNLRWESSDGPRDSRRLR